MTGVRVAVLELPARFDAAARALADIDELLAEAGPVDLAVVPEAAITGYVSPALDSDLRRFAEPLFGPTTEAVRVLARRHGVHLAAPLVEAHDGGFANTTLLVAPDGALLARYRKRHPWYVETWATPGDEPLPIAVVNGARVTIATCFDVHFLADESHEELRAADLLIFPSAWVDEEDSRPALLGRIAKDFDVAVANANWGPGRPRARGQGGSMIVGRGGAVVARAAGGVRVIVAEV